LIVNASPLNHGANPFRGRPPAPLITALLVALSLLAGCASTPTEEDPGSYDPFEPINRKVYTFNRAVDRALLRPVARGYDAVVPGPAKTAVTNVFDNISTPIWVLNHLLQGSFAEAGKQSVRFLLNSTVGLAGILDTTADSGLTKNPARFDQTFGKWGIPSGPYLMLPILGPNTPRSAVGWYARFQTDVIWNELEDERGLRDKLVVLEIIDQRYQLLRIDSMLERAPDPYIFVREAYKQRTEYAIRGAPEEEVFEFDD